MPYCENSDNIIYNAQVSQSPPWLNSGSVPAYKLATDHSIEIYTELQGNTLALQISQSVRQSASQSVS